jgi:hypothetical protein
MSSAQARSQVQQVRTTAQTASNFTDDQSVRTLAAAVLSLADAESSSSRSLNLSVDVPERITLWFSLAGDLRNRWWAQRLPSSS